MTAENERQRLKNDERYQKQLKIFEEQTNRQRQLKLWLLDCIENGIDSIEKIFVQPEILNMPFYRRTEIEQGIHELIAVGAIEHRLMVNKQGKKQVVMCLIK